MLAVAVVFLGFLVVAAGREEDVPLPAGDGGVGRHSTPRVAAAASASAAGNEERLDRPAAEVGRRAADDRLFQCKVARARAGVAAVEDHRDVRPLGGDLADQLGDLLVGEVPASLVPAIEADERLVEVVGLELPELLGGLLLRAVAAVIEERDVAFALRLEVAAEPIDDGLAGRLGVLERLDR